MNVLEMVKWFWDWSRGICGSIVMFCVFVSLDLLIVELFYYHGKKWRAARKASSEEKSE